MKIAAVMIAGIALVLTSCQEEAARISSPVQIDENAMGYYCQMNVLEHSGPKAQIHLAKSPSPIWFTQVRDAIAFTRSPEETDEVLAIYVNDMGKAVSWQNPGKDNWIEVGSAYFVLDSAKQGGMGAPEAVPFGTADAARAFSIANGGKVVQLAQIPDEYVLGPVEVNLSDSNKNSDQPAASNHKTKHGELDHHSTNHQGSTQ